MVNCDTVDANATAITSHFIPNITFNTPSTTVPISHPPSPHTKSKPRTTSLCMYNLQMRITYLSHSCTPPTQSTTPLYSYLNTSDRHSIVLFQIIHQIHHLGLTHGRAHCLIRFVQDPEGEHDPQAVEEDEVEPAVMC